MSRCEGENPTKNKILNQQETWKRPQRHQNFKQKYHPLAPHHNRLRKATAKLRQKERERKVKTFCFKSFFLKVAHADYCCSDWIFVHFRALFDYAFQRLLPDIKRRPRGGGHRRETKWAWLAFFSFFPPALKHWHCDGRWNPPKT